MSSLISSRPGTMSNWTPDMESYCRGRSLSEPRPTSTQIADEMRKRYEIEDLFPEDVRSFWRRRMNSSSSGEVFDSRFILNQEGFQAEGETALPEGYVPPVPHSRLKDYLGFIRGTEGPKEHWLDNAPFWRTYRDAVRQPNLRKADMRDVLGKLSEGVRRVAVLSDMHIPIHDRDMLDWFYRNNPANEVDAIVLNGDTTNFDAISRYLSLDPEPITWDVEARLEFGEQLSDLYPDVPVLELEGNHQFRVARTLYQHVDPMLLDVVSTRFHAAMCRPFPTHYAIDNWNFWLGDVVFSHGEKRVGFTTVRKPVEAFQDYFLRACVSRGIMPPKAIVQGHTHKLGKHWRLGGVLFWAGTFSKVPSYTQAPDMTYGGEDQTNGYVIVTLKDGRYVDNESHCFSYGGN